MPAELNGLPFLRTANNDDRLMTDRLVSFRSESEVDVLVGVDVRNQAPLTWMNVEQPGGFRDTGLELVTTDPVFKLYEKRFPAGEITLGANLNHPRDSRRGNYIVVFKRNLLSREEDAKSVTIDEVVAAMPNADASRGRELFFHPQGAGCFKCHRMQGIGNVLGPDLSDIGSRSKTATILIESIVEPSKVITEGFAQQQVLTADGTVHLGSVLEETGRVLKLADSNGNVTTIEKAAIDERIGTKVSPMPSDFAKRMTAQQIADLTAWLLTQKTTGDREGFWFKESIESLEIHFGPQRVATYLKEHPKLTRRALVNVMTPSGIQLTRNFPPREPEDIDPGYRAESGIIHPIMHPGIWLGFGDISGNDYWRLQSHVVFDRFSEQTVGDRTSGGFSAVNRLMSQDTTQEICRETTRYRFERVSEGYLLDVEATYQSESQDFYFGDQEESGLAIRVASPIRVQGGNGTIVNDRGERNGGQVWGKHANWFDYFGTINGREVGILVVPDPRNPRPSWLHARDYGVVVTNPFPKQPHERREPFVKTTIKKGETFRLAYMILLHETEQPMDRQSVAARILRRFAPTPN